MLYYINFSIQHSLHSFSNLYLGMFTQIFFKVNFWKEFEKSAIFLDHVIYIKYIYIHCAHTWSNHFIKQESPPAWTQEAYHPSCSEYSFCCPNWVPPILTWPGGWGYPAMGGGGGYPIWVPPVLALGVPCGGYPAGGGYPARGVPCQGYPTWVPHPGLGGTLPKGVPYLGTALAGYTPILTW